MELGGAGYYAGSLWILRLRGARELSSKDKLLLWSRYADLAADGGLWGFVVGTSNLYT